jgi:hypothetical protein
MIFLVSVSHIARITDLGHCTKLLFKMESHELFARTGLETRSS